MNIFNYKQKEFIAYDIYSEMLDFGSKHMVDGVSLNDIKRHLKNKNLLQDGDLGDYLHQWFSWSFEHRETTCTCKLRPENKCGCDNDDPCDDWDHESNCKHFISKDSCIDLLHLKESKNNAESANWAKRNGNIALTVALISLLSPFLFDKCYNSKEDINLESISKNTNTQIEQLKTTISLQQTIVNQQTTLLNNLNHKTDSLSLLLAKEKESLKTEKPKINNY